MIDKNIKDLEKEMEKDFHIIGKKEFPDSTFFYLKFKNKKELKKYGKN